jgi:esterase/lipase superfamily enzyme
MTDVHVVGHGGRPVLVFPSAERDRYEWERNGMVDAVRDLIDAGRCTLYCVDSWDSGTWWDDWLPLEERARRHEAYERWVLEVAPGDDVITTGVSMGAYHAANLALRHPHRFPLALCFSGIYDVAPIGWGERGDAVYFNNPLDYVAHLGGDHLEWLRGRVSLLLVAGQGQWEDTTGALESTRRFAELLAAKGIPHELDLWGHDVPHDWPSWRAQIAHHLPRFV